jgi:hypothetical protein
MPQRFTSTHTGMLRGKPLTSPRKAARLAARAAAGGDLNRQQRRAIAAAGLVPILPPATIPAQETRMPNIRISFTNRTKLLDLIKEHGDPAEGGCFNYHPGFSDAVILGLVAQTYGFPLTLAGLAGTRREVLGNFTRKIKPPKPAPAADRIDALEARVADLERRLIGF